jgi:hypothetical protein
VCPRIVQRGEAIGWWFLSSVRFVGSSCAEPFGIVSVTGRAKLTWWLDFGGALHESYGAEPHHSLGPVPPLTCGTSSRLAPDADGGGLRRNHGPGDCQKQHCFWFFSRNS